MKGATCNPRSLFSSSSFKCSNEIKLQPLGFHRDKKPFQLLKNSNQKLQSFQSLRFQRKFFSGEIKVNGSRGEHLSPLDDKPFELLPGGKRIYIDEQDIVTLVDPPKELIPLDRDSYNPAGYLWKKIADIPEERRHRLLYLLKSRLISRIWAMAGTRYSDSNLVKQIESNVQSVEENLVSPEFWSCQTSGGPMPIAWMNHFKKALFCSRDGNTYGRILPGGSILARIANSLSPLYFTVRLVKEVMATEQPCDLAYEFGDGLLDLHDYPKGFPHAAKHPWPFNDHVVVYVRHVGPGVLVGQAWQEGKMLEQVPKKFCGEILMVKDYTALQPARKT